MQCSGHEASMLLLRVWRRMTTSTIRWMQRLSRLLMNGGHSAAGVQDACAVAAPLGTHVTLSPPVLSVFAPYLVLLTCSCLLPTTLAAIVAGVNPPMRFAATCCSPTPMGGLCCGASDRIRFAASAAHRPPLPPLETALDLTHPPLPWITGLSAHTTLLPLLL
jgi:hypothetical protein